MDNSKKPEVFTFGKIRNQEDSDVEGSSDDSADKDSVSAERHMAGIKNQKDSNVEESSDDSADEDSVSSERGNKSSSSTHEIHQQLVKEMQKLSRTVPPTTSSISYDVYKRRNYNGLDSDATQPRPRYGINQERRNLLGMDQTLRDRRPAPLDNTQLPSEVTDREYIYMPSTSKGIDEEEDMDISGKWMLFPDGDLEKLDQYWLAFIPLYKNGTLTRIKCSTAMGSDSGVINCYTGDSENLKDIKNAADAIRRLIDYDQPMYYKTNEATALGLYNRFGCKSISKYMHTVNNFLYQKVNFDRWKLVSP